MKTWHLLKILSYIILPMVGAWCAYAWLEWREDSLRLVEYATTNSEMRHVVLPDSTQVWLSTGSVLFCPEKFMGKTREVYLSGEAFFHVQKADCPFRVNTDKLSADISEATFGITAYPDMEEVMTTLLDGKFVLSFKNRKQFLADETGIRYDYNAANNRLIKTSVNLDKIAWGMKGYLVFQGVSVDCLASTLERHFNVIFNYEETETARKRLTITFPPDADIQEVMSVLGKMITDMNFSVTKREV